MRLGDLKEQRVLTELVFLSIWTAFANGSNIRRDTSCALTVRTPGDSAQLNRYNVFCC